MSEFLLLGLSNVNVEKVAELGFELTPYNQKSYALLLDHTNRDIAVLTE